MRRLRSESGFGLVGVLIAMVLLAIGTAALGSSSRFAMALKTESQVRSTATAIAAAYLEEVKMRDLSKLVSEEPVRVNSTGHEDENGAFVRSMTVTPEADMEDTKRIMIDVRYPSGLGANRSVELITIVYHGSWQEST